MQDGTNRTTNKKIHKQTGWSIELLCNYKRRKESKVFSINFFQLTVFGQQPLRSTLILNIFLSVCSQ